MLRSQEERAGRMAAWGQAWEPALNDHYRRFSLPEAYAWQMAPIDEEPPAELAAMMDGIGR
jgi:hypothetical protein